jgi:hypothetical protein
MKKPILLLSAFSVAASSASASVFINEVLASTTGPDVEFFELFNSGASAVDLTGWTLTVYESDGGNPTFGNPDSTYTFGTASIAAGGYFTALNAEAQSPSFFGISGDDTLADNFFENSSSTYVLFDGTSNVDIVFMTDGDAGDEANINGTSVTAGLSVGPDGTFFPAGFTRIGDGGSTANLLDFGSPTNGATPGAANPVPEPSAFALLAGLIGLACVTGRRRR